MQYTSVAMNQSFREIIKREMKRRDMSAYRLAKLVEGRIPPRSVYAYMTGTDIGGETVAILAEALQLQLRPVRRKGGV
jgi:hypothetical protein